MLGATWRLCQYTAANGSAFAGAPLCPLDDVLHYHRHALPFCILSSLLTMATNAAKANVFHDQPDDCASNSRACLQSFIFRWTPPRPRDLLALMTRRPTLFREATCTETLGVTLSSSVVAGLNDHGGAFMLSTLQNTTRSQRISGRARILQVLGSIMDLQHKNFTLIERDIASPLGTHPDKDATGCPPARMQGPARPAFLFLMFGFCSDNAFHHRLPFPCSCSLFASAPRRPMQKPRPAADQQWLVVRVTLSEGRSRCWRHYFYS